VIINNERDGCEKQCQYRVDAGSNGGANSTAAVVSGSVGAGFVDGIVVAEFVGGDIGRII
jgi:hypothetical protein